MTAQSASGGWLHRLTDSDVWWSFKSSPLTVIAAAATFFIVAVAFLSPILAPHTPFDPATLDPEVRRANDAIPPGSTP